MSGLKRDVGLRRVWGTGLNIIKRHCKIYSQKTNENLSKEQRL